MARDSATGPPEFDYEVELAAHNWKTRADLAKRPGLPAWVVSRLANDDHPWVVAEVAVWHRLTPNDIDVALRSKPRLYPEGQQPTPTDDWGPAWKFIARKQKLNNQQYQRLLAFGTGRTTWGLAESQFEHPDWVLMALAKSRDPLTREYTAYRKQGLPVEALELLSHDDEVFVRAAVARRADLPHWLHNQLVKDPAVARILRRSVADD